MCAARTHERTLLPDNAYVLPIFCFPETSRRRPRYCRGILVGFAFFLTSLLRLSNEPARGAWRRPAAVAVDGDGDEDEETFLCLLLLLQMFGLDLGPQCEGECHPIGED